MRRSDEFSTLLVDVSDEKRLIQVAVEATMVGRYINYHQQTHDVYMTSEVSNKTTMLVPVLINSTDITQQNANSNHQPLQMSPSSSGRPSGIP